MHNFGPRPLPVWPLEGIKYLFSIANYSVMAADIAAVLSPLCAPLRSLYTPLAHGGYDPHFWGQVPLTLNLRFGTLRFFRSLRFSVTLLIVRGNCLLCTVKIS